MDVQLYIYDLSRGMARQYSMALTGIQIDAIYHTAIVFGGVEYFFGQGIHRKVPGTTHHGQPMRVVNMGQTQLPSDLIQEYIQSLEAIYTPQSYDLFNHNCNNFSQDLAMFLVGQGIPEEVRKLPETFLSTPIGQMLRGQIDQSMRQMTQAPDAVAGANVNMPPAATKTNGATSARLNGNNHQSKPVQGISIINGHDIEPTPGHVYNVSSSTELDKLLKQAESTCACLFFTSATCPPCKLVYPVYDQMAEEAGNRATLIKIDTQAGFDLARRYQVTATPSFFTILKGEEFESWSGADAAKVRGNIRLLMQMANPQHAHTRLRLPHLHGKIQKPITYTRIPPLDKLLAKLGSSANDTAIQNLVKYIRTRESQGLDSAPLPDLHAFSDWISVFPSLPADSHFAVVDLLRIAATDPRVSSYLAAEKEYRTLHTIIPENITTAPYNLQVVTLQLANNLFSSTIFQETLLSPDSATLSMIENLASNSLLATHHNTRALAAALVYNIAAYNHNQRIDGREETVSSQVDIEAALVEAVINEENKDTIHALLLALGILLYCAPPESSIWDLCSAMEVRAALKGKTKNPVFKGEELLREIGEELLAKGNA